MIFLLLVIALLFPINAIAASCDRWCERCEEYRETVQITLINNGVSPDYYYLMVAESGCKENAQSAKGALGFWQLTGATARKYGCANPHDLGCATRAAALYIRHLERMFDSFDAVIMAYNMGGHNLKRYGATREAKALAWTVKRILKCQCRMEAGKGTK